MQEPFNIVARQRWLSPRPEHQFLYIHDATSEQWEARIERVLALRYPLVDHLRQRPGLATAKRMTLIAIEARLAGRRGASALVKDPIALFSMPWLRRRFAMEAVVLVRDPVSFVGSLKERDWHFDFRNWTEQPALMRDLLHEHRDSIQSMIDGRADIVDQGIVQWNAFYDVVDRFRREDPGIVVIDHKQFATNPLVEVESLYERLGLRFGPDQRAVVSKLSTGPDAGSSAIDVRRNSSHAVESWRARLDAEETRRIRSGTEEVASRFGWPEGRPGDPPGA